MSSAACIFCKIIKGMSNPITAHKSSFAHPLRGRDKTSYLFK